MLVRRKRLLVFLPLLLMMGLLGGITMVSRQGLPLFAGSLRTAVQKEVIIYRDSRGIPYIQAQNKGDLFFAQGYIQAMDRLWQMDLSRRAVEGRLSEIFGEDFLPTDVFLRSLLMHHTAQSTVPLLGPLALQLLKAYTAGVNAYLEDNRNNLPPEFFLLGYTPEEWRMEDSLGIGKFMAWELGGNMKTELFLWAALSTLPEELAQALFPSYPQDGPTILAPGKAASPDEILSQLQFISRLQAGVPGQSLGSNNWVVGGEMTASGDALLANDMHLVMGLPSIWYQTRLEIPGELTLRGVIFPGIPGIIVGRNQSLAWGVTNMGPDVQDLYRERQHPEDPYLFAYHGEWHRAQVLEETFSVKGQDTPVVREILITHNGPLIFPGEEPMSLRWTAHDHTFEIEALIRLALARDWETFLEALEYFHVPAQNFVMADREGNIGYRANGRIPIRNKGEGLIPAPGWDPQYQWQGYIPYEELPTIYNGGEGFISTANHKVVPDTYPYHLSHEWAPPYRAMAIQEHLAGKKDLVLKDMMDLQNNVDNLQARILLPLLKEDLFSRTWSSQEKQALELLYQWGAEPRDDPSKPGPAIYHTLYLKALEKTFSAAMGPDLYREFLQLPVVNLFDSMLLEGSIWLEEGGGRRHIVQEAFAAAVNHLAEKLGDTVMDWAWGDLHSIHLTHQLGEIPLLGRFISEGPYPLGGSHLTVAAASYSFAQPYGVVTAAPWRFICDLGDMAGNTWENLAGGVVGHPLSSHYRDQTSFWLAGEYTPIYGEIYQREDREDFQTLHLIPED